MPRGPLHLQAPPGHALLADVDGDVQRVAVRRATDRPPILGQDVVRPERVPVRLAHMASAERAASLLVGAGEVDETPTRPPPPWPPGQRLQSHGLGSREIQHVERPSPPHLTVHQLSPEGITRPRLRIDRDDIGVAHQAQRRRRRVTALDAGYQARPARGRRGVVDLEVEPAALEVGPQHVGRTHFLARADGTVVHALVTDQLLQ